MRGKRSPEPDRPAIFWGEMAPSEHLLQVYDDRGSFLDSLEGFVGGGLQAGEAVVVIATAPVRNGLRSRLEAAGHEVAAAVADDRYIALDAEETLARFMREGWPADEPFTQVITGILGRAGHPGRRVRAFGEMVAVLWAQGHVGATVRLEHLWHRLCEEESFPLFCAYPRIGLTQGPEESVREICETHSRIV
jgi:hypothetical protein